MSCASSSLRVAIVVLAVIAAAVVAGLATGVIRVSRERARRAGGRAVVSLDAAFAPQGRQDALNYLLDDQHRVVMEQELGDGNDDGGTPSVLYTYPDEAQGEHARPV